MHDMTKQAKQKALSLLNFMDRTESGLRQKLKEKSFCEEAIDEAIDYVKSFGYINDVGYAERYILNKRGNKSKKEIQVVLEQKGVSREDIETAMANCYDSEDEIFAIQALCKKKNFVIEEATKTQQMKMYQYLLRKGFRGSDICKVLKVE